MEAWRVDSEELSMGTDLARSTLWSYEYDMYFFTCTGIPGTWYYFSCLYKYYVLCIVLSSAGVHLRAAEKSCAALVEDAKGISTR